MGKEGGDRKGKGDRVLPFPPCGEILARLQTWTYISSAVC